MTQQVHRIEAMSSVHPAALVAELTSAYANRLTSVVPPSAREEGFDLAAAYAVEAELARGRRAEGRAVVGRKVGYANKAMWRVLKLKTLVWAHMYDDTVRFAEGNTASLSIGSMCSPRIEPEIVFKLKQPLSDAADAVAALEAVEWIALGFEIIDSVFVDWTFQPSDFVASFGLHAALIVGEPRPLEPHMVPAIVEQLPQFTVTLSTGGQIVAEGSGKNSLRSPALCLCELASALSGQPDAEPLGAGELVSSGTLTDARAIAPGQTWTAHLEGLGLADLTLKTTA